MFGHAKEVKGQKLRVLLVGFADRWADYGSRGDTPSFRDFLALRRGQRGALSEFINLRLLYWPQDNADPKKLAESPSREITLDAAREATCDESFSSLNSSGQVSFLDPEMKHSRFVILQHAPAMRPRAEAILPCYEVK